MLAHYGLKVMTVGGEDLGGWLNMGFFYPVFKIIFGNNITHVFKN